MSRLKENEIRLQAIESRIIDLTNWTEVEWTRILKTNDKSKLIRLCQKKLLREKIDKKVLDFFQKLPINLRTLNDLRKWELELESFGSEDGKLASQIVSFLHKCIRREVNLFLTPLREHD
ncbi:3679_t:CDS:2 [Entrophospora sp. SA101]|nr:3679_t:CDS:2 [Entrophospora sp. SA101]